MNKGISGFTFLRNAHRLYYPIIESIMSILPIIDEMIIVLGKGDANDNTFNLLLAIDSQKIKIIHSEWDLEKYKDGTIYAQQTDLAKQHCRYEWLFYLQGDEVIHEKDIAFIKESCIKYENDKRVEGFVLDYLHFFGDYEHYFSDHCWYQKEIRIIRNITEIHSWRDAQSFRWIEDFDGITYHQKENTRALNCVSIPATVYHYGWVRPPKIMKQKNNTSANYYGYQTAHLYEDNFDYGRIDRCSVFNDAHPTVMRERIAALDWKPLLRHDGPIAINRPYMKHEKWKYRLIILIEKYFFGGRVIGGFKNFNLIK